MKTLKYRFYATLLNSFSDYLRSSEIYQQYWGFSENPEKTEEEFEQSQFQSLIDTINRVPFDSEPADKGTAFNEVVDCIIENRKSDKMEITSNSETQVINVKYNNRFFEFPAYLCKEFALYLKGGLLQQRVSGVIKTRFGLVEVYGNLDALLPASVHDIKTTNKYSAFRYRHGWQHIVYPFCLCQTGNLVYDFEYNVTDFKNTYTENYTFVPERDIPLLSLHCENLIEFIEMNRGLITDTKVFNL
jgi:hypothetical protein